jgi:hypothetical protein
MLKKQRGSLSKFNRHSKALLQIHLETVLDVIPPKNLAPRLSHPKRMRYANRLLPKEDSYKMKLANDFFFEFLGQIAHLANCIGATFCLHHSFNALQPSAMRCKWSMRCKVQSMQRRGHFDDQRHPCLVPESCLGSAKQEGTIGYQRDEVPKAEYAGPNPPTGKRQQPTCSPHRSSPWRKES